MREIVQHSFGGPEVLEIVSAPTPAVMPTEVLVRVTAIGLNPLESRVRSGEFPFLGNPPFVLGWDVSGVVEESRSFRFRPGDEVLGMPWFPRPARAYAEFVATPALHLVRKPDSLSHVEAAALPVAGLTAWQALVDLGGVSAGDRVLIHGAAGGVGHLAVQIAAARGAHVVATARATSHDFVAGLGAHEIIDHTAVEFERMLRGVDLVLDTVGGDTARRSVDVLREGGHLVTAVADEDVDLMASTAAAGVRFSGVAVDPDPVALAGLVALVEAGRLRPHVDETFRFDEIVDAHRRLDQGHLRGKTVLTDVH